MQRAAGALVMSRREPLGASKKLHTKHKFGPCLHSSVMGDTGVFIQFDIHYTG